MSSIFDALPGLEVPVEAIAARLAALWTDKANAGQSAPADEARAMQINLVLHFGFATTADDALRQFRTAVRFSASYPSRVVVLCPQAPGDPATELRAKIYGECFLGRSRSDARCCEFVLLSYPQMARQFLEHQVSICLSPDLPLYYWAHRFSDCSRLNDYRYLLTSARRFVFDGAVVPVAALDYAWPRPEAVRDLAAARLLPVRQTLGQFLAGYAPSRLVDGLQAVSVRHAPALAGEGRALLRWAQVRLSSCGAIATTVTFAATPVGEPTTSQLTLQFAYADGNAFTWQGDFASGAAAFRVKFAPEEETKIATHAGLLSPEQALGESFFF